MGFGLNNFLAGVGMNDRAMLQAQQDLANQQILQARADQATQENPSAIQAGIASNNATAAQGNLTAGTTNASVPGAIATAGQKSDIQTSAAQQFAPYVDQAGSAVAKANLNNYGAGVSGSQAQLYGAQAQALSQEAALNSTPVTIAANNLAQSGDLGSRRAAAAFQAYRPLIDPNNPNVSASVEALKNLQSTGALDAAFPGHQLDPNSEVADIKISGQPGARTFQIIEKDSGGNLKPVGSPIPEAWFQDATHQVLAAANESKVIKPGETVGTFNPRTGQFSTGYSKSTPITRPIAPFNCNLKK